MTASENEPFRLMENRLTKERIGTGNRCERPRGILCYSRYHLILLKEMLSFCFLSGIDLHTLGQ